MSSLIRFACPACGKTVKTPAQQAGKRARCPSSACGHTFRIPGPMSSPTDLEPLPPARAASPTGPALTAPPPGSRPVLPWLVAGLATLAFVTTLSLWLLSSRDPETLAQGQLTLAPRPTESTITAAAEQPTSPSNKIVPQATNPTAPSVPNPAVAKDSASLEPASAETHKLLDELAGEWETPAFKLKIEKGGTGRFEWLFDGGQQLALTVGDLRVESKDARIVISMSPRVFGQKYDYQFAAVLSPDKMTLSLEETQGQARSRTLKRKSPQAARTSAPDTASVPTTPVAQGLPTDGPGDPALTYDTVKENTAKHRGKRVTWAFVPCSSEGKRMMCALNLNDAVGPRHYGIYVVEFASEKEAGDAFLAAKPGSTITGTIAGQVDQFLVVKGPDGVAQKDIPKVTVPLLLFPRYTTGTSDKKKEPPGSVPPLKPTAPQPQGSAPKAGAVSLSDLRITKTTFEPPSVEFTIRMDLAGGEFLEAWASVGVPNAGKVLEIFAGALDQGLLSVDGIDFANPSPSLKAQRVSMKKSDPDTNTYTCYVRYPKLRLDNPETEFTIVAAVRQGEKVVKSNAATVRVNLRQGASDLNRSGPLQGTWKPAEVRRFEAESSAVAFSPDGKRIVALSGQLELSEWEIATGQRVRHQPAQDKHTLLGNSGDLRYGLSLQRPQANVLGQLHLWDLTRGQSLRSWPEPAGAWEKYAPRAVLSPEAALAAALYQEPTIRRLPGGGLQIGGEAKKEVFFWDFATGRAVQPIPVQAEGAIAFAPDGQWLVADDAQKNIRVWETKTGKPVRTLTGTPGSPLRLHVSADRRYIAASCSDEGKYPVIVWDAQTGDVLHKLAAQKSFVRSAAFSPDGRTLLCAERGDDTKGIPPVFRLWEIATGRELGSFTVPTLSDVYAVAFSPDGTMFVSAGYASKQGIVQVWSSPKS